MSNDLVVDFVEPPVIEIDLLAQALTVDLIEPAPIEINFPAENQELSLEFIEPPVIEIHFLAGSGGGGGIQSIVAGTGINIDDTDPRNPIVSATALPTELYRIENEELTSTYAYAGYEATEGDWYIYRRTRATNVREYAFGITDYSTSWADRASLTYS
jgi:hypothetical protein